MRIPIPAPVGRQKQRRRRMDLHAGSPAEAPQPQCGAASPPVSALLAAARNPRLRAAYRDAALETKRSPLMHHTNRQWRLASYPQGIPTENNWTLEEGPIPEPGAGEMLVRAIYLDAGPAATGPPGTIPPGWTAPSRPGSMPTRRADLRGAPGWGPTPAATRSRAAS